MIHFKLIETSDNYDVVIKEFINLAKQIGYNIKSSSNDISNLSWFIIQFKNNKEMLFQRGASSNCWLISYSPKFNICLSIYCGNTTNSLRVFESRFL